VVRFHHVIGFVLHDPRPSSSTAARGGFIDATALMECDANSSWCDMMGFHHEPVCPLDRTTVHPCSALSWPLVPFLFTTMRTFFQCIITHTSRRLSLSL
jgi:hypothetical protein